MPGFCPARPESTWMKVMIAVLLACTLYGCASGITLEPDKAGAEHQCATASPHLADYNACMERVDAEYRAYEIQRKLDDEDDS